MIKNHKNKIAKYFPPKRKVFRNNSLKRETYRITRVYPSLRGFAGEGSPFG